jgi:type IV secretion system protein VirB10
MFVYSRGYGGAKYFDTETTNTAQPADDLNRAMLEILSSAASATSENSIEPLPSAEQHTKLVYSGLTPVVVHEGEMLEAVLVNRLLVNTEPSPVICHLSRDLFDRSGQYVIFPANSRVIGSSQAITYKGASRLFISFHRIILPNGLSVDLPQSQRMMKALDETGALGIVSNVNRHWFLQFGTAVMLGVLDGIAGYAQRDQAATVNGLVISRTSENFDRVLDRVMAQYSSIVPTIRVDQGKTLRIYISDDMLVSPYARISERSYYGLR